MASGGLLASDGSISGRMVGISCPAASTNVVVDPTGAGLGGGCLLGEAARCIGGRAGGIPGLPGGVFLDGLDAGPGGRYFKTFGLLPPRNKQKLLCQKHLLLNCYGQICKIK